MDRLDVDRAMVLVIDLQTKLLPLVAAHDALLASALKLLAGTRVFGVPVLATEQYPKGIGPTHDAIRRGIEDPGTESSGRARVVEKPTFSACREPAVRAALADIDRPQVIVTGIETHVCVQQTVLDLVAMDYDVFVCADAVGSRGAIDHERALLRMQHVGAAVTTVESVLFELCDRCDTARFKQMLKVIKASPPRDR
ncbi:MAG: isochorismatase family protein [Phycisphaerae bacterium]